MNKFRSKFCRLLTPLAVLCLAFVMTIAAPMTSLMGALRVNAVTETNGAFDITNLPARYAKVGETITVPTVSGGATAVWHANKLFDVTGSYTYPEVGQYEWRFYADANETSLINTYSVTVTQPDYAITMPSVVPTVAPKNLAKLVLPLPEKLTADGKEITDQLNGTDYQLHVTASLGNQTYPTDVKYTTETDGTGNVTIDLSSLSDNQRVGTLQVTYLLQDQAGKNLVAQVLADIEIKNITPDQVTFSSNPSAPSVQNLSYCQEITLTAPTANSATDGETTFNVEATTKIIAVKFYNGSKQPSDWNKDKNVTTVNCDSGYVDNDFVKIDGLKVTTKQLGWYKFQFETTTLFGNDSANSDEEDGKYWSDAVNIKSDSRAPEFKFVKTYTNTADDDAANELNGVAFADIEDQYSKRYPFSTSSTEPATDDQKILVDPDMTLYLPAIFAVDNATARKDLRMSISVAQVKDSNGQKITSDKSNTQAVYLNNAYHPDNQYDPTKTLRINFGSSSTPTDGNYINLTNSAGLYLITLSVEDIAPKYGNGDATNSTSPRRTTKYLYFQLAGDKVDINTNQYAPKIDDFAVSDVYLWEGNTFDFAVPTYSDSYTPTSNLVMDYYLVNNGTSQAFRLDNDAISGGRMYVDLDEVITASDELATFVDNPTDVKIYAIARNFTSLQNEFTDSLDYTNLTYDQVTGLTTEAKGLTVKAVAFTMHKETSAVATGVTVTLDNGTDGKTDYQAGKAVRIKEAKATFGNETDARISVSVYQLKEDGTRVAVDVVNNNADNAKANEKVAAVAFCQNSYSISNWYFTPRNSGYYQVVVTAKDNASNAIKTQVQTIEVKPNDDYVPMSLSTMSSISGAPDATLTVGTVGRVVVPNVGKAGDTKPTYTAKNRKLYDASGTAAGHYTITVKGICDPDCLTGERFVPHQAGTYTFTIDYYLGDAMTNKLMSTDYVVEVTSDGSDATSAIKLNTAYGEQERLTNADGEGTATSPKYAVTLEQFMTANYGGSTNFIIDSKFLQNNLETIKDADMDSDTSYKYMYPAIAIPMPNPISGSTVEDVEITVQKSGYNDKLVSSKTAIGKDENGDNKYSVIDMVDGYWVFRPDGKFKNNGDNYLASGDDSVSAVYVVTYKTKSASLTFNLTIGNPNKGALSFNDGFLTYDSGKKTIEKGTTPVIDKDSDGKRYVTINLNQLNFTGNTDFMNLIARGSASEYENVEDDRSNEYLWQRVNVSVTFEGSTYIATSGWNEEDGSKDNNAHTYRFNVAESGTYTVTVSLFNPYVNQTVTQTFDFTIDVTATNKNVNLSTVWGVILVILSVGLLAGVIFYFVKTARETRFLDNPKAPKAKKEKTNKKVKDQKEDVK